MIFLNDFGISYHYFFFMYMYYKSTFTIKHFVFIYSLSIICTWYTWQTQACKLVDSISQYKHFYFLEEKVLEGTGLLSIFHRKTCTHNVHFERLLNISCTFFSFLARRDCSFTLLLALVWNDYCIVWTRLAAWILSRLSFKQHLKCQCRYRVTWMTRVKWLNTKSNIPTKHIRNSTVFRNASLSFHCYFAIVRSCESFVSSYALYLSPLTPISLPDSCSLESVTVIGHGTWMGK